MLELLQKNLFQVDLDKQWNCLWYCYEKQWYWRWGCRGCKRTPKGFDLLKIWAKALKKRVKMVPNAVWLQNMAPNVCIKTHETFSEVTPKRGLHDLCGRKFVGKSRTKTFRASLGKFGQNPSNPKNLPAPTPMMKRQLRPRRPSFEKAEVEMLSLCLHSPASLCILFYTHFLYSLL